MRRGMILLGLALTLVLAACSAKTELHFNNRTECGTATIALTNTATGHHRDYTVDQGDEISIEVDPDVLYRYEVTYPRLSEPNDTTNQRQCDAKTVETQLSSGQRINVSLESVPDADAAG